MSEQNEGYPDGWVRLNLMVSPTGEYHAVGGERAPGEGDMPYIGLERMRKASSAVEAEPVAWCSMLGEFAHIKWGNRRPDDAIHHTPLYTHPTKPCSRCAELEATIAQQAQRLHDYEENQLHLVNEKQLWKDRFEEQAEEIARLQEDAKRLNKLEKIIVFRDIEIEEREPKHSEFRIRFDGSDYDDTYNGRTLREAIDAAIKESKEAQS